MLIPKQIFQLQSFFEIAAPENSQDAPSLKEATISVIVNSGFNSGLIRLLQEDYPWLSFI